MKQKLGNINLVSPFMYLLSDPCIKAQCVNHGTCVSDADSLSGYKCLCTLNSAGMNIHVNVTFIDQFSECNFFIAKKGMGR